MRARSRAANGTQKTIKIRHVPRYSCGLNPHAPKPAVRPAEEALFPSHTHAAPHFRATPLRSLRRLAIVCSFAGEFRSPLVYDAPCSPCAHAAQFPFDGFLPTGSVWSSPIRTAHRDQALRSRTMWDRSAPKLLPSTERLAGYRQAHVEAGLDVDLDLVRPQVDGSSTSSATCASCRKVPTGRPRSSRWAHICLPA
jgi:hypothetical protein